MLYGNGNENRELGVAFFAHKGILTVGKELEFVSGRMSCVILRGRWCDILNMHAPRVG
jgi:hypothetical protein